MVHICSPATWEAEVRASPEPRFKTCLGSRARVMARGGGGGGGEYWKGGRKGNGREETEMRMEGDRKL